MKKVIVHSAASRDIYHLSGEPSNRLLRDFVRAGFCRWRHKVAKTETFSSEALGLDGDILSLDRRCFTERLHIEANLKRDGLLFLVFACLVTCYFQWMMGYDPLESIALVHQNLMSRFRIQDTKYVKTIDGINQYLNFFLRTSYDMASALVDASTLDQIDLDRCASSSVEDVCQLKYWSLPIDRPGDPEYVNITAIERDTLASSNAESVMDCGRPDSPPNCIPRGVGSPNVDPQLQHRTFGLTPEDPMILRSRLDFPLASVVALAPLAFTRRAPRVDCEGFGLDYNDNVLGAGTCSADSACNPEHVTSFESSRPNSRTNRTQSIFLTYEEFAFYCVDRDRESEEWTDKSWSPWATYEELTEGKPLTATELDGKKVFWKFISNLAYLQAPIEIPLSPNHCSLAKQHPELPLDRLCALEDAGCIDPMRRSDHAMWSEPLGYGADCSLRKAWSEAYLATPIEARNNVWFTIETTELSVAILVVTPQMANRADLVTLVQVTFKVGQYGDIKSDYTMDTTSVTTQTWHVLSVITAVVAVLHAIASWLLVMPPRGRTRMFADIFVSGMCIIHVVWLYIVEISPPYIMEDLIEAFHANRQEAYFATFKDILGYTVILNRISIFGFMTVTFLFCRFITHLMLHPRLAVLPMTLYVCLSDIVQFFVSMSLIELFLACFAYICFSSKQPEFGSIQSALWAQLMMFFGERITDPDRVPSVLYLCYLFIAVLVVIMALLNFLLAIIVDGYSKVTSALVDSEAEGTLFWDVYDIIVSTVMFHIKGWPRQRFLVEALERRHEQDSKPVTAEELKLLRWHRGQTNRGEDEEAEAPLMFKNTASAVAFIKFYAAKRGGALVHCEEDEEELMGSSGLTPVGGLQTLAERQSELERQVHELKVLAQQQMELQLQICNSLACPNCPKSVDI